MSKKRRHMSIGLQILAFFSALLVAIGILIVLPVTNYFRKESDSNLQQLEAKELEAMDVRLQSVMDNFSLLARMTFMSGEVQRDIIYGKETYKTNTIHNNLITMMINSNLIQNDVFLTKERHYVATLFSQQLSTHPDILQQNYDSLTQSDGSVEYSPQMQQYLSFEPGFDSITFYTCINSLYDFKNIGILLFNVEKSKLEETIFRKDDPMDFIILDQEGEMILASGAVATENISLAMKAYEQKNPFQILRHGMQERTISQYNSKLFAWTFISVSENIRGDLYRFFYYAIFSVLFIAGIFLLCHLYITFSIIKPIGKLQKSMAKVRYQVFQPVVVKDQLFSSEITELQSIFNDMILKIMLLKRDIKEKEALKRKHEIFLLQEQIKPHFLYNTLDAISALNLVGENELAFELTTALSGFYRTSLSNANIFVTVKSEMACVQNYIKILQIRYKNRFEAFVEVESALLDMEMPKLVLQPIVENAIKHGLLSKREKGLLKIVGKLEGTSIVFIIEDNGMGISAEKIAQIQEGKFDKGGSFGLYNVVQKLTLYGAAKPVRIESVIGAYTQVYVYIPQKEIDDVALENEDV